MATWPLGGQHVKAAPEKRLSLAQAISLDKLQVAGSRRLHGSPVRKDAPSVSQRGFAPTSRLTEGHRAVQGSKANGVSAANGGHSAVAPKGGLAAAIVAAARGGNHSPQQSLVRAAQTAHHAAISGNLSSATATVPRSPPRPPRTRSQPPGGRSSGQRSAKNLETLDLEAHREIEQQQFELVTNQQQLELALQEAHREIEAQLQAAETLRNSLEEALKEQDRLASSATEAWLSAAAGGVRAMVGVLSKACQRRLLGAWGRLRTQGGFGHYGHTPTRCLAEVNGELHVVHAVDPGSHSYGHKGYGRRGRQPLARGGQAPASGLGHSGGCSRSVEYRADLHFLVPKLATHRRLACLRAPFVVWRQLAFAEARGLRVACSTIEDLLLSRLAVLVVRCLGAWRTSAARRTRKADQRIVLEVAATEFASEVELLRDRLERREQWCEELGQRHEEYQWWHTELREVASDRAAERKEAVESLRSCEEETAQLAKQHRTDSAHREQLMAEKVLLREELARLSYEFAISVEPGSAGSRRAEAMSMELTEEVCGQLLTNQPDATWEFTQQLSANLDASRRELFQAHIELRDYKLRAHQEDQELIALQMRTVVMEEGEGVGREAVLWSEEEISRLQLDLEFKDGKVARLRDERRYYESEVAQLKYLVEGAEEMLVLQGQELWQNVQDRNLETEARRARQNLERDEELSTMMMLRERDQRDQELSTMMMLRERDQEVATMEMYAWEQEQEMSQKRAWRSEQDERDAQLKKRDERARRSARDRERLQNERRLFLWEEEQEERDRELILQTRRKSEISEAGSSLQASMEQLVSEVSEARKPKQERRGADDSFTNDWGTVSNPVVLREVRESDVAVAKAEAILGQAKMQAERLCERVEEVEESKRSARSASDYSLNRKPMSSRSLGKLGLMEPNDIGEAGSLRSDKSSSARQRRQSVGETASPSSARSLPASQVMEAATSSQHKLYGQELFKQSSSCLLPNSASSPLLNVPRVLEAAGAGRNSNNQSGSSQNSSARGNEGNPARSAEAAEQLAQRLLAQRFPSSSDAGLISQTHSGASTPGPLTRSARSNGTTTWGELHRVVPPEKKETFADWVGERGGRPSGAVSNESSRVHSARGGGAGPPHQLGTSSHLLTASNSLRHPGSPPPGVSR